MTGFLDVTLDLQVGCPLKGCFTLPEFVSSGSGRTEVLDRVRLSNPLSVGFPSGSGRLLPLTVIFHYL